MISLRKLVQFEQILNARYNRVCNKPFLYSDGTWLIKFKYTPLNVFFQKKEVFNLFPTLVVVMFRSAILLLCSSSNMNLIF